MKTIVSCKKCSTKLQVSFDDGKPLEKFTCPVCNAENTFSEAQVQAKNIGWLQYYLQGKGVEKLMLAVGTNTIGRKSENSTATLQVASPDTFLSRNHFTIEITENKRSGYDYILKDNNSTNGVFVNNSEDKVVYGEEILLAHNDSIKAGNFVFYFKTPEGDAAESVKTIIDTNRTNIIT